MGKTLSPTCRRVTRAGVCCRHESFHTGRRVVSLGYAGGPAASVSIELTTYIKMELLTTRLMVALYVWSGVSITSIHEKYLKPRQLYENHKKRPQDHNTTYFSADLEKVLILPRLESFKAAIFCHRLVAYNHTFAPLGKITSSSIQRYTQHTYLAG